MAINIDILCFIKKKWYKNLTNKIYMKKAMHKNAFNKVLLLKTLDKKF